MIPDINGYTCSDQLLDDLYINGWYKVGDSLAKDLGFYTYIKHIISSRTKRAKLKFYYKYIWNGKLTYKRQENLK